MNMPGADTLILLLIAMLNAWVAWISWKTKQYVSETKAAVEKTEVNTNSMREQLVAATEEAAHAAGRNEMRKEAEAAAANRAKGAEQERGKT